MASPDHTRRRVRRIAAGALTLLLLPVLDLSAQTCTAPSFAVSPQAQTTLTANDIVSADFDRDGNLDVAFTFSIPPSTALVGVRLGSASGNLGPGIASSAGAAPLALRAGDFNRDGLLDLAVSNYTAGTGGVSILIGTGGGAFAPPLTYPVLANPTSLAIADFDHDGDLDIVASTGLAGATADLLNGLGNGTFAPAVSFAVGGRADQAIAGDVLRDGDPDLVVVDAVANVVRVIPGNGNGTFAAPLAAVPVKATPWGIDLADWNGDGELDAVVAGSGLNPGVSVLFGNGTGTLAGRLDYPTTALLAPTWKALGADLDGDGDLDIAVAHAAASPTPNAGSASMSVLINGGTGLFAPPVEFNSTASTTLGLTVGDFDRDGRSDVVTANPGAAFLSLFRNDFGVACLRPSFGRTPQRVAGGGSSEAIAAVDWNGDGRDDLFTADFNEDVHYYLAKDGAFEYQGAISSEPLSAPVWLVAGDIIPGGGPDLLIVRQELDGDEILILQSGGGSTTLSVGTAPAAAVVEDFNGDGINDIAVTNLDDGEVSLFYGNGTGFAGPATTVPAGGGFPLGLVAGDFREDGFPDLLVVDEDGPVWLLPNSPTGFVDPPAVVATLNGPSYVVAGNFGGSPALDAMVTDTFNDEVVLLVGDGSGGFAAPSGYSVPSEPLGLDTGDLNGDGFADVAVASGLDGSAWVLMGLPAGGFSPPVEYSAGGLQVGIVMQDLTGDGLDDVAVGNGRGAHLLVGSSTGNGTLEEPARITLPADGDAVRLGDLDGDGDQDLVVALTAAGDVGVALGAGDGTFGALTPYAMPSPPGFPVVADFNNDGAPDVVVSRSSLDNISLMRGVGDGTFGGVSSWAANNNPTQMAAGDFNRDGNLDLAVVNDVDALGGGVTIFRGDGLGGFTLYTQVGQANAPRAIAASDVDRNGILDLVVAYGPSAANHYFLPLLGDGSGGFTAGTPVNFVDTAFDPSGVVYADFNRDGLPDVAVAGSSARQVEVHWGLGTGLFFATPTTVLLQGPGSDLAVADWDGDGWPQLAVGEGNGDSVAFTPNVISFQPVLFRHAARGRANGVAAGDLNGDGRPDLVVLESLLSDDDTVAILLNTNCQPRRLRIDQQPSTCAAPSTPFASQPLLSITDDASSTLACATGALTADVTASLLPNVYGGALINDITATPAAGVASFVDLGVSTAGRSYQLGFSHPAAGSARSRTFSQGLGALGLGITGQASVCSSDAPLTYLTAEGYDSYDWTLSGAPVASATWKAVLGPIPAGLYSLDVAVTQDGCAASATPFALTSSNALSAVSVSVVGSTEVPASGGAGGTATATPTGGDAVQYQWRYQKSGGAVRDLGTPTTDPAHVINGSDFADGAGTYDLWVVATPTLCGTSQTSNLVTVTVYTATGNSADAVEHLTATARSTQVTLEWVNPSLGADYVGNRIQYTEGAGCSAPAGLNEGTSLGSPVGIAGQKDAFTDSGLANGLTRCYSVFVEKDDPGGTLVVSPARSIKARTIGSDEDAVWVFSTQMSVITPPGVGGGRVYVVSNDSRLYSVVGGAGGGVWTSGWTPPIFANPSEGRPTSIPLTGTFSPVIYLGSDDGSGGGRLHAIDPATGGNVWSPVTLADPVLATPSATFTQFGGVDDLILVGTRNTSGFSTFYARDPVDGSAVWEFSGDASNRIGLVNAQASVDYLGDRVYFTSTEYASGHDTVWCLQLADGQPCSPWNLPTGLGGLSTSPIPRGDMLYVAPADGTVRGLDIDGSGNDGSEQWSFTTNDGPVKDFVFPAFGSSEVYFSTDDTVWCRTDTGADLVAKWSVATISNPSTPILMIERNEVWVGSGDGKLHVLDASTGAPPAYALDPFVLADTGTAIGSPTIDRDGGYVYVGAVDGRVFAVPFP